MIFVFALQKVKNRILMQCKEIGYEHLSGSPNRNRCSGKANGIQKLYCVTALNISRKLCYTVQVNS